MFNKTAILKKGEKLEQILEKYGVKGQDEQRQCIIELINEMIKK